MKILKRHIVVTGSDDGTFQGGDHLVYFEDGKVGCVESQGWIDKEDFISASKGMISEADTLWVERQKQILLQKIRDLEDLGR